MKINYTILESMPEDRFREGLLKLHQSIFGQSDDLFAKMAEKKRLVFILAKDADQVIGYKIGYEKEPSRFYSWLGGVDADYRQKGIASALMEIQHKYAQEKGYTVIETKTMNKWRSMLLLNIRHGFDIVSTYIDKKGNHKIILERHI